MEDVGEELKEAVSGHFTGHGQRLMMIKLFSTFRVGLDSLRQKTLNQLGLESEIDFLSCA